MVKTVPGIGEDRMKFGAVACAITVAGIAMPATAQTYGDTLAARIARANPGVTGIAIDAAGKAGKPIHVAWGTTADQAPVFDLANATGDRVGTIRITSQRKLDVAAIARNAARRIYVADNLAEPDPFVAGATRSPRGQAIVDATIDANPDLVTLAFHVALPGGGNTIVASNFGRIGKPADADDADVVANGTVRTEVTDGGRRLAVELPLLDAKRRVIGALSTSFTMRGADDQKRVQARAVDVRDAIARRIPTLSALASR